jgi:hypothetical protein
MYGDESADETKSRAFAVAGVVGSDDEWAPAIRAWLRRTRGLPFHANHCESEFAHHPDTQKHKDNLKLYKDLTTILVESDLAGFAVALDLESHRAMFPEVERDFAYFKALADLIGSSAGTAKRINEDRTLDWDVRLEYTFDSRLESDGTASILYTMLSNEPEWAGTGIFDTGIKFEGGDEPRLEMADLLARESMKELDRKITNSTRPMRRSRQALEHSGKFKFLERRRDYWERLRAVVQKDGAAVIADFARWLIDTGRIQNGRPADTMANWFLYNAWLYNRDAVTTKRRASSSGV